MIPTIYTSLLTFDSYAPGTRAAMADAEKMHRTVMGGFTHLLTPSTTRARSRLNILYTTRTTTHGTVDVIVQAPHRPRWDGVDGVVSQWRNPLTVPQQGEQCLFRLVANIVTGTSATGGGHRPITDRQGQEGWLDRHASHGGFAVDNVRFDGSTTLVSPDKDRTTGRGTGRFAMTLTTIYGRLTVTDPDVFATTLVAGVGRGRAYGAGLLLLRRPGARGN